MVWFTTGFIAMRWGLFSALMMFVASTLKVRCRQSSHAFLAFVFGIVGLVMSCWFVAGLLGMPLSTSGFHHALTVIKETFVDILSQQPASWPLP